ncbi:hypothetical protein ACTQ3Z_11215 [Lawsonibacter sp. LCP25S3_F5]|jgi:hypothetical protein
MAKANQPNSQQKPQPDRPDDLNQDQQEPYVPASPVKRTMAWIGIVYMVILLCLTTFYFYTGRMLGNLAPLLTVPGLIGLGALILVSWHSTGHPRRGLAFGLSLLCFCLAAFTLPIGLLGLMSNF